MIDADQLLIVLKIPVYFEYTGIILYYNKVS